jgi:ribokinase
MRPEILTAGGVTVDNIVTADGRVFAGQLGGNALHAAVGAALWGVAAGMAARVPADYPAALLTALFESGLRCDGLRREAAMAPMREWFFHHAFGGRRDHVHATAEEAEAAGILGRDGDGGGGRDGAIAAWEQCLAARRPSEETFAAFRRAHPVTPETIPDQAWPTLGLHVGPGEPEAMLALARAGKARGLIVTLDPGFAAARCPPALLDAMLATVDAFLPSEKELALLCPGSVPLEAVRALSSRAKGIVCAKLGADGALLIERQGQPVVHVPTAPVVAIDPVGAGDSFAGGLLAGLVRGEAPLFAACRGAASASFTVAAVGALAPLASSTAEVERRLAMVVASLIIGGQE